MKRFLLVSFLSLTVISSAFAMQETREPSIRSNNPSESASKEPKPTKSNSEDSYKKESQPERLREQEAQNQIQEQKDEVLSRSFDTSKRSEPRVFGKAGL